MVAAKGPLSSEDKRLSAVYRGRLLRGETILVKWILDRMLDVVLLKCFAKALSILHEVAPLYSQKCTCKPKSSCRQHDALALILVTASVAEDQAVNEVVGVPCKHGSEAPWAILIAPHDRWIAWTHVGCTISPLLASAIFVAVRMAVIGSLICKPELLVSIPFALLRAMPSYFEYAANRMWGQLEQ